MKKVLWSLTAAVLVAAGAAAEGGKATAAEKDVVWPAEAVAWTAGPVAGVQVANLWGAMDKGGAYGALLRFDAGLMHPLHWHSRTLKLVVISGTFVHHPEGGEEKRLGPGSYLLQAGKGRHVSGCAAGVPCVFFMTSDGTFDMTVVGAPAEKK